MDPQMPSASPVHTYTHFLITVYKAMPLTQRCGAYSNPRDPLRSIFQGSSSSAVFARNGKQHYLMWLCILGNQANRRPTNSSSVHKEYRVQRRSPFHWFQQKSRFRSNRINNSTAM